MPKSPAKPHTTASDTPGAAPPAVRADKGKAKDSKDARIKAKEHAAGGSAARTAPETVNGNTRVNVAFPFSKIEVQEPSAELVELAGLLVDLIEVLADWVPEETLRDIRARAEAVCARLAT